MFLLSSGAAFSWRVEHGFLHLFAFILCDGRSDLHVRTTSLFVLVLLLAFLFAQLFPFFHLMTSTFSLIVFLLLVYSPLDSHCRIDQYVSMLRLSKWKLIDWSLVFSWPSWLEYFVYTCCQQLIRCWAWTALVENSLMWVETETDLQSHCPWCLKLAGSTKPWAY